MVTEMSENNKMPQLLNALDDYLEAKAEHDTQRDTGEVRDWGYYGSPYIKRLQEAREEFEDKLNAVIDSRVNAILEARDSEKK
jgi:hypothetical protein